MLCCLGYLWMVYLGLQVVIERKVDEVDRSLGRQDKSLFRLGLSWLEWQLKNGRHFLVMFEPPKHFVLSDVSLARHWPVM